MSSVLAIAIGSAASAQDATRCYNLPDLQDRAAAMQVTGSGSAYFHEAQSDQCPPARAQCERRAYLLPGDHVLARDIGAGFHCVWYVNAKDRETFGLIASDRLRPDQASAEPASARWVGVWTMTGFEAPHPNDDDLGSPDVEIAIAAGPTGLKATGDAAFPYRDGTGEPSAHIGSFGEDGARPVMLKGGQALIADEDCKLVLRMFGDRLLVVDNSQCAGFGASFSGYYRKTGPIPQEKSGRP